MKILVTGANGYLGTGIVRKLIKRGVDVVATDFKVDNIDKLTEKKACNLFEIENPYDFFGKPDVLLHLAWRNGFIHYSPTHIIDLPRHFEFIKNFCESGCKQIAVMGSMHEIGFFEGCINENTPCRPITPYGISKNALRELTQMLCEQNNNIFQWLRGFYIVGNSKNGSSVFSKIVSSAEEGKKEFPFTMGKNQYDFIDYDRFCDNVASVVSQNQINGVINICSGFPERLSNRVERFIKDNNFTIKLNYGAFPDRPYDSKAIWGDNKKLEEILEREKNENTFNNA